MQGIYFSVREVVDSTSRSLRKAFESSRSEKSFYLCVYFKVKALFAEVAKHMLCLKLLLKFKHALKAFTEWGRAQIR